MKMMGKT